MSSYFTSLTSSNAISNLSTRFTSLRRAISAGEEKDDPDCEDSSHISNVLRAYYTEKGRRLPPWLPPDRKAAVSPPAVVTQSNFQGRSDPNLPQTAGRGGLGDLWGDSGPAQPPPQQVTSSLRQGRAANHHVAQLPPASAPLPNRPATTTPTNRGQGGYFDRSNAPGPPAQPAGGRPLPSQRVGSYQTSQAASHLARPEAPHRNGSSAQERLRARFQGGGGGGAYGGPPSNEGGGGYPRKPLNAFRGP